MKKLFSLLSVSFAFLISVNAQSLLDIQNPVLSNPAIANYNEQNVLINNAQIHTRIWRYPFDNNFSYFTNINGLNVSLNNGVHRSMFINSISQSFAFSKGINLRNGKFFLGAGGVLAYSEVNQRRGSPFSPATKTRLGYGLDLGINYEIGNHQIGIGFNNVLGRSSINDTTLNDTKYHPINFRYQTTLFVKDFEIQPYFIHTSYFSNEGHDPRNVRNYYPSSYSLVGLSAKYHGFKIGLLTNIEYPDIAHTYLSYGTMLGYDFKKLSINYGTRFYYADFEYARFGRTISHNLSIRYHFNGIEKGTQLF